MPMARTASTGSPRTTTSSESFRRIARCPRCATSAPTPAIDSDCSPVVVSLADGTLDTSIDFGFVPAGMAQIGDFVWNDLDADGLQEAGEPGIDQAKVMLWDDQGNLVGVRWTGPDGLYLFQGLCAGLYKIEVDVTASGAGFVPSPCLVGFDPTIDNNCSPDWILLPADDTVDETVDFGFHDGGGGDFEGCGQGYWKNHPGSWPSPYTPGTLFSDVFEDAFPGKTLMEVIWTGGGHLTALGRHTVAALLNAASPGVHYPRTAQGVIQSFNAVYPSSNGQYEQLKDEFEADNELGCPLN